jgi:hypothetical protein
MVINSTIVGNPEGKLKDLAPARRTKSEIETSADRPKALTVKPEGIPTELREWPQWVCWRYHRREGKWTKVPIDPKTGKFAKVNDPATFGSFDQANARQGGRRAD